MGCYNATCGISNLPIKSEEKIILFVIKHKGQFARTKSSGFCNTDDQFTPIAVPIHGTYNDYGGIEYISHNENLAFEYLSSYRFKIIEEKLKLEGLDGTPKNLEELLNDYIGLGVYEGIGFMLVREEIYFELINSQINLRNKLIYQAKAYINTCHEYLEKLEKSLTNEHEAVKKYRKSSLNRDVLTGFDVDDNDFKEFFKFTMLAENGELRSIQKLFTMLPDQQDDTLMDSIVNLALINEALSGLRKFWTIQSGAGSQSEELNLHKVLALKILEHTIIEEAVDQALNGSDNWTEEQKEDFNDQSQTEEEYLEKYKLKALANFQEFKKLI